MELRPLRKVQGLQLHDAVFLAAVGNVDALIYGKAVDFSVLVINVRAEGGKYGRGRMQQLLALSRKSLNTAYQIPC